MEDTIDSSLFKEIGHTLETVANDTLLSTVSSLKTAIARRAAQTTEGQAVAAHNMGSWLIPAIIVAVVLFVFFRR